MKPEDKSIRIGAAAVAGALILRLFSGSLPEKLTGFFSDPDVVAAIMLLETGRVLVPPQLTQEPVSTTEATAAPLEIPVFSAEDVPLIAINNASSLSTDPESWLTSPLTLSLTGDDPTVLILHSHTSECYADTPEGADAYRTQDESKNMLAVGQALTQQLQAAGISVLHDRTVHDYPSYNGSYTLSRATVRKYLEAYPSIQLVLDLHRDAMTDTSGNQIASTVETPDGAAAQLMLVVGTNSGRLTHPGWQQNMALAAKLHAQLERQCPGICRPISIRSQRFNHDLSPGAMLIEVGAAGNTLAEALGAVKVLSTAIIHLAHGANV